MKETYFALKGGINDGFWHSDFIYPGTLVIKVEITTASGYEDEGNSAKVFVGEHLVGFLPGKV